MKTCLNSWVTGLIAWALIAGTVAGCGADSLAQQGLRLYELRSHRVVAGPEALSQLRKARVILVGERHTDPNDHRAQLEVIRRLHESGVPLAIGLEMFRRDGKADLDRWVTGKLDESSFEPIYRDHWNIDWQLYRPIFIYAQREAIPMVGLNVPAEITRQVARHGFASLTPEQRGLLDNVTCDVSQDYRDFVERAHGAHGHGGISFERFCEAQLVWDIAMATHAVTFLADHPDMTLIILAGSGHARKQGIPAQIRKLAPLETTVIIPRTPGSQSETLDAADADWLLLLD